MGSMRLAVKEITVLPSMTPIPHAPDAVRGYVNLRGQIVLVLDLESVDALGRVDGWFRIAIGRVPRHLGDSFGVLVDSIGDMAELSGESIERPGNGSSRAENRRHAPVEELIFGVGKLETGCSRFSMPANCCRLSKRKLRNTTKRLIIESILTWENSP